MRWQCALLQRWLPEYPDGDLPAVAKRWLKAHVERCSACRQEVAGFKEAVAAIEATPVDDPGSEFWNQFSRELHVKLAQAAAAGQEPAPRRWGFRLPYLIGVPALTVLLVWMAVYYTGSGNPVQNQHLARQAQAPAEVAKMAPVKPPAPAAGENDQIMPVALEEGGAVPTEEVDISGWDLDSELSGMTDQEKERFLDKLRQGAKGGSCVEGLSYCSWG